MGDAHRVGVVGLGVISRAYLDTLVGRPGVRVTAVADLDASRSAAAAAELPGVRALTVEELLGSPDVDTVLNLTTPAAHAEIALGAIRHHDDLIDVLATTTHPVRPWQPWHRPVTSPAVWTRRWGAGRIVVTTPGHSVDVLEHPDVRTIIERGMLWATRTASGS